MRPSNDANQDKRVDLTTLGVVDLNTSIMPDVFGLRWFGSCPANSRIVRVLVPDATAMPVGCHDVMLENLSNKPDYHARSILPVDINSLRRRWPSSLFADMHRRQADIEFLRRNCKWEFDSEFGGGRAGTCPHCGTYVVSNMFRLIIEYIYIFEGQSALALSGRVVFGLEGDGTGLHGSLAWPTQRGSTGGA